jgi:hypothetical protein
MPKNPKLMFQICQKDLVGFSIGFAYRLGVAPGQLMQSAARESGFNGRK